MQQTRRCTKITQCTADACRFLKSKTRQKTRSSSNSGCSDSTGVSSYPESGSGKCSICDSQCSPASDSACNSTKFDRDTEQCSTSASCTCKAARSGSRECTAIDQIESPVSTQTTLSTQANLPIRQRYQGQLTDPDEWMRTYREKFIGTPSSATSTQPQASPASAGPATIATRPAAYVESPSNRLIEERDATSRGASLATMQTAATTSAAKVTETKQNQFKSQGNASVEAPSTLFLEDEIIKSTSQNTRGHAKCGILECTKVFQDLSYWRKHVDKAHSDWLEDLKVDSVHLLLFCF